MVEILVYLLFHFFHISPPSSAGITNFDLLGSFAEVKWLNNMYIVLLYNAVFAAAAATCLINHFTARIREEIVRRFALVFHAIVPVARVRAAASACSLRVGAAARNGAQAARAFNQR